MIFLLKLSYIRMHCILYAKIFDADWSDLKMAFFGENIKISL